MSDSTSNLPQVVAANNADAVVNQLIDAASPATLFGRNAATSTGLTWGYLGGVVFIGGARTLINNGTLTLAASTTNYVEVDQTGALSVNSTGPTPSKLLLYTIVAGASTVTSYQDARSKVALVAFFFQYVAVAMANADKTLTQAQDLCSTVECTGALTADRNLVTAVARGRFVVYNNTTGGFNIIVKTPAGTGVTVAPGVRAMVEVDGVNVNLISNSTGGYTLPVSTASVLGGVKVGAGVAADGAGVLSVTELVNAQTGTSYTYLAGDNRKLVTHANAASIAGSLPQAGASFPNGWSMDVLNAGVGTLTITPATSTIDGSSSLSLTTGQGIRIVSDGTNYFSLRGAGGYSLPAATASIRGGITVGAGLSIAGDVLSNPGAAPGTQSITDFANAPGTTTGLTFGYQAGVIRSDNVTTAVAPGTVALTASTTNYVEVTGAGVVSANTTGFTSGRFPLCTVLTGASTITTITDKRGVMSVGGAGGSFTGGTLTGALNEAPTVTIASSATVNIGAAAANTINVTGTTAITAFDTIAAGAIRRVVFAGALTLTHNATSLILPGNVSITTEANDVAEFISLGSGNWLCTNYKKAQGGAIGTDKARIYCNAAFTVPATTMTKVPMDTVDFDTNSIADVVTNRRLTPKKAGYYTVTGRASLTGTGAGQRVFTMLYKNGVEAARGVDAVSASSSQGIGAHATDLLYFNGSTDYVELYIYSSVSLVLEAVYKPLHYLSAVGPL